MLMISLPRAVAHDVTYDYRRLGINTGKQPGSSLLDAQDDCRVYNSYHFCPCALFPMPS